MTALRELQRGFQGYVIGEAHGPPATVADTGAASAEVRMQVYADAVRLRFLDVLGQDYPGLHALLGDEEFRSLGLAYIAAHPSHHPSIRWFGRHLPEFTGSTAPWRSHPVLGEMARFEWARGALLDAADSPVVGIADIAAVAPERWAGIRPRLKPAVRRLTLEWNVPALRDAVGRGDTPPDPARSEPAVDWLLWRDGLVVRWRSLGSDEAWALQCCDDGEDFGAICVGLGEWVEEDAVALRAATFLKQWATDGVLESI